jgi:hypothetical protein
MHLFILACIFFELQVSLAQANFLYLSLIFQTLVQVISDTP